MPVTIHDVAQRAGVSISTVSRVLNNTCKVNEAKKQRVEEAVRELGYTPNQVARNLLKKKTGGVGIILPYVGGEFFSEFLNGIDMTAQEHGYHVMISTSHDDMATMTVALRHMNNLVDGLLVMAPPGAAAEIERVLPAATTVVFVNTPVENTRFDVVNFDNYRGGYLATKHLLKLGHKQIAILKGPDHAFDAQERLRGYRQALEEAGITPLPNLEITGDYTQEAGFNAVSTLLNMHPLPTAVFAANDQSGIALMGGLSQAGVRIPEDLSLVGFDDIPSAKYTVPSLSSIHVPIRQLGVRSIERLIARIKQKTEPPQEEVLPVTLVTRRSSAAITQPAPR